MINFGDIYSFNNKTEYWVCTKNISKDGSDCSYGITTKEIDTEFYKDNCNKLYYKYHDEDNKECTRIFYFPENENHKILFSDLTKQYNDVKLIYSCKNFCDNNFNIDLARTISNCCYYRDIKEFYDKNESYDTNSIHMGSVLHFNDDKVFIFLDYNDLSRLYFGYTYNVNNNSEKYGYLSVGFLYDNNDDYTVIGFVKPSKFYDLRTLYDNGVNFRYSVSEEFIHYFNR